MMISDIFPMLEITRSVCTKTLYEIILIHINLASNKTSLSYIHGIYP